MRASLSRNGNVSSGSASNERGQARNMLHGYIMPTLQHSEPRKVRETTVMDNGLVMDRWTDAASEIARLHS